MRIWGLAVLGLWAAACSDDIDRDIEDRLTIGTGVYGQALASDDDGGDDTHYLADVALEVRSGGVVVAMTHTDDHGFYQVELAPMDGYSICSPTGICLDFTVLELARVDYAGGIDRFSFVRNWAREG